MKEIKNKNSFLITCVSCIVILLVLCYFGINTTLKGTAAAEECSVDGVNGRKYLDAATGDYYCIDEDEIGDYQVIAVTGGYACHVYLTTYMCSDISDAWEEIAPSPRLCQASLSECKGKLISDSSTTTTYTIRFDPNGGTGGPGTQVVTVQDGNKLPTNTPKREGFTFKFWTITKDSNSRIDLIPGAAFDWSNGDVTLYAYWEANEYTVSFNTDGGSSVASQTVEHGNKVTKPTDPTKSGGYTFAGWTLNGSNYDFNSAVTGDITLVAKWTTTSSGGETGDDGGSLTAKYSVKYNANGGTGAPSPQVKNGGTPLTLSSTRPTNNGFTFNGWNTEADGSGTSYAAGGTYTADQSVTLYAQWTPNPSDGDSGSSGGAGTGEEEIVKYTVKYDANNGSGAPKSQTKTKDVDLVLSTTTPTRSGYTFKHWNSKEDGTGSSYKAGAKYTSNSNITLYAQWTKNAVVEDTDNEGNTTENPKTGEIVIALVWFFGLAAIGYSFYYFKSVQKD